MQIKRFEAQNMTEALRRVKQEFGPDAVILSARTLSKDIGIFGLLKRPGVEVTAATDHHDAERQRQSGPRKGLKTRTDRFEPWTGRDNKLNAASMASPWRQMKLVKKPDPVPAYCRIHSNAAEIFLRMRRRMLSQGVEEKIAEELINHVKGKALSEDFSTEKDIRKYFVAACKDLGLSCSPIEFPDKKQRVVALIGPAGVGKTNTAAKLAVIYARNLKRKVGFITLDNYRIAATVQLNIYAKIIGIPLESASDKKQFSKALKKLRNNDLILIDTPGISRSNLKYLKEIRGFFDSVPSLETHLLLSATTKEQDMVDILNGASVLSLNKLLFTKLDESSSYGNLLNQWVQAKKPVSYFTTGDQVPENIEMATIEKMLDLVLADRQVSISPWASLKTAEHHFKEEEERELNRSYYIANKKSDLFHSPECRWTKRIKTENMVRFQNIAEAMRNEFKPCRSCICSEELNEATPLEVSSAEKQIGSHR